ncbi:MAG: ferrous iron transport protein B [Bacillota bacterium]|nr:ferrous iron transport protein B [Bacillota bacterium]
MRIAFAGNPNSGKTTMYNVLAGQREKTGNWGGVTVASKIAEFKREFSMGRNITAVDLPGAYSMSPFTPEESITSGFIRDEHPDAIINIVDATSLNRSLFLTTQLLELGIPVVVALNKNDIIAKDGTRIDEKLLSERLNCPVIKTSAINNKDKGMKEVALAAAELAAKKEGQTAPYRQEHINMHDKEAVDEQDRKRFAFVNRITAEVQVKEVPDDSVTVSDKIDRVVTNPIAGIIIFAAVMWLVFQLSQAWVGPVAADWLTGWIGKFQETVDNWTSGGPAIVNTLLAEGIVGGVGAVVGFLPLIMVLFFFIALLEDCGYMARVSALMDPIFKRVGLSGKSVITMVVGVGCAVPAVMSTRTIRDIQERRSIAMLTSWIPCGAKLPVIALFAGVFFGGAGWVSMVSYVTGIVLIFLGALIIKAVTGSKFRKSFFIMELPQWKRPSIKGAVVSMFERAKAYIIKAATIILVCNCVVTIMANYDWSFNLVGEADQNSSILASIAGPFALLLIPLGMGTWQLAAAAITGFIAKENVVGTIAVVYGITRFIDTDELAMTGGSTEIAAAMGLTSVTALAYLFFNLFTPPCFAAIGAMNAEMQHKGWLWSGIGLQLCTGYTVAFLVAQFGSLIVYGSLLPGFVSGLVAIGAMVLIAVMISRHIRSEFDKKYSFNVQAG